MEAGTFAHEAARQAKQQWCCSPVSRLLLLLPFSMALGCAFCGSSHDGDDAYGHGLRVSPRPCQGSATTHFLVVSVDTLRSLISSGVGGDWSMNCVVRAIS